MKFGYKLEGPEQEPIRRAFKIMEIGTRGGLVLAFALVLSVCTVLCTADSPEVCARAGCVVGLSFEGQGGGRPFEAFLGLPYARPPTERFRFQNPRPLPTWGAATWNGTYSRQECIQMNTFRGSNEVTGDEDCLFLNVYRPKLRKRSLMPVIVYLHGGAFRYGDANMTSLGPEYFMESDVILVTVQYRLNIFGFLSSGDDSCPGNFGLKDQAQALRWLRRNIQNFGGDPKSVTLMGHSSGAAAVHLHMMSETSNDLFHRGVALSGTGIADWAFELNPLTLFKQQIKVSGLSQTVTASNRNAVRELRRLDAKKLFRDSLQLIGGIDKMTLFKPTIEPRGPAAFLTANPKTIWEKGTYKQRPLLLSFVPVEGGLAATYFKSEDELNKMNLNVDKVLSAMLELTPENVAKVKERYLGGGEKKVAMEDLKTIMQLIGDRYFYHPLHRTVSQFIEYGNTTDNPIFLIKFDFKGAFSHSKLYTNSDVDLGIIHGDDLVYYFTSPRLLAPFGRNTLDGKMSHILVQTLVNFATTETIQWQSFEPCTKEVKTDTCDYQVFQRYTKSEPNRILISVRNNFDREMVKFWDNIVDNNFQ